MTRAEDLLPAEEQDRLAACAKEPIHVSGAVQPHGVLVAVDRLSLEIVQVSDNTLRLLGIEPADLLGRPLDIVRAPGPGWRDAVTRPGLGAENPHRVQVQERHFDAVGHVSGDLGILELEPATPADPHLLSMVHAAARRLSRSGTVEQLRADAAREVRAITGFDRVMVYHFHPDGHGEVVAEDRADGLEPYLGLHYPASDIPAQARRLYVRQPSRHVAASEDVSAPLLGRAGAGPEPALDLSHAELRSVSPHHLRFMRNMGVGASVSFSLVRDGELVGMLSCNHGEPRYVPYLVRRGCELLAQQVALQLRAMVETDRLTRRLQVQQVRSQLVTQMVSRDDVAAGLVDGDLTVLDLVGADGAAVRLDGRLTSVGDTPPPHLVEVAFAAVGRSAPSLVTEALTTDRPDLGRLLPAVAGLLVVPFGGDGDYLAWFRREVIRSVDWLGDQSPENRATPLSPRSSFGLWRQSVTDRSRAWDEEEVGQAEELSRDVDNVLLRRAEARLAHLGLHDSLTGLPNRRLLMDRLEHALTRHARGSPVALLFIDLDRFKLVNDSFGHDIGDQLIIGAAARISAVIRDTDTVARLGGDEFVVLCEDTDATAAHLLAQRVVDAFAEPVQVAGRELRITASVGITVAQQHHSPADLLREADTAMFRSKQQGRNRSTRFEDGLRQQAMRRLNTEQALQQGLAGGELQLHHQPVVRSADGALMGVESLLRWDRPGHGRMLPDDFVPLAEDTGFIVAIGEWVLDEALGRLAAWRREGLVRSDFTIAVNVSPRQLLDTSFARTVERLLARHGVVPADLVLEITETALMTERSAMCDAVTALHRLGVCLSIDDFGTGYSSLSYLRYLPVGQLKVDRSFVAEVTTSPRDSALVAAVIGLAHEFSMTCVAEGVETAEQMQRLVDLGCDYAQGYLLGRPVPASTLTQAWRRDAADRAGVVD